MNTISIVALTLWASLSSGSLSNLWSQSTDTTPAVRWNAVAYRFVNRTAPPTRSAQPASGPGTASRTIGPLRLRDRMNPLVNVVAYLAIDSAARDATSPSRRAAVATAAASVLAVFLPDLKAEFEREVEHDIELERRAGLSSARIDGGARIGRVIAARTAKWAGAERDDVPWSGTVPTGSGMWRSAPGAQPGLTARLGDRPWALRSADQFRPKPPPDYDSPAFDSALDEVRRVAHDRTPEQTRIEQRWGLEAAVDSWAKIMNDALTRRRVDEVRAARTLALVGIATYDAGIACTDAKYHYWLIRPTQADSMIPLAERLTLPNFPSYPSGHACLSGAISETFGHFVPEARAEVARLADEAAMSRLYAGVHYRFDNDVGLELGRQGARCVVAEDSAGRLMGRLR